MRVCPKSKNLAFLVDVFPQTFYHEGFFYAEKMNTQEIWKPVAECNGEYYVSSWGRVKSYKNGKEIILKPGIHKNGYLLISLSKNKTAKTYHIHRLVAQAFIINENNKLTVNHKDGDKKNNNVYNLEWMTHHENVQHAIKNQLDIRVKPVLDIVTGLQFISIAEACRSIGECRHKHRMRIVKKSPLQRFFYINDNGNR